MTGGLILQYLLGCNFSVAVWVGYIALFGIAVETGVVMVVYLHESLDKRIASGAPLKHEDIEAAFIDGAVMKTIAAPMVGGMITSTIHVLILVPVFFAFMKERRCGTLRIKGDTEQN